MNKQLLLKQVSECKGYVEKIDFGRRTLFFLKSEFNQEIRNDYIDLIGQKKLDKVFSEMLKDPEFRNFMLVNLQEIFRRLRGQREGRTYQYNCILDKQESTDIYEIIVHDYFGFLTNPSEDVAATLDTQLIDFSLDLTKQFKKEIYFMKTGRILEDPQIDVEKEIIQQVKNLMRVGEFTRDENIIVSQKSALIRNAFDDEKLRAFFSAWQLNMFFEQFVAKLIEKETGAKVFLNKRLCVLPSIGRDSRTGEQFLDGFIELDILAYDERNDKIIMVECKNAKLTEEQISKFIGRTKLIESSYEFEIDKKIMVGTKYLDYFFRPLPQKTAIVGINCFDNKKYRQSCYSELIDFIKS